MTKRKNFLIKAKEKRQGTGKSLLKGN